MFSGKTFVITGGSSGLGRALSVEFARLGGFIVAGGRQEEELEKTADLVKNIGGQVITVKGDITRPDDCKELIDRAVERFGSLDHLVLNAGVSQWAAFEDTKDLSVFQKLLDVNCLGPIYCTYHGLPYLKKNGGLITAISSILGKIGSPYHAGYAASKHGLEGFMSSLRMELHGSGVDILMVQPRWIRDTGMRENAYGADGQLMGDKKKAHTRSSVTLEDCCQKILRAMRKRQRELFIPSKFKYVPLLNQIAPSFLDKIIRKKVDSQK